MSIIEDCEKTARKIHSSIVVLGSLLYSIVAVSHYSCWVSPIINNHEKIERDWNIIFFELVLSIHLLETTSENFSKNNKKQQQHRESFPCIHYSIHSLLYIIHFPYLNLQNLHSLHRLLQEKFHLSSCCTNTKH